MRILLLIFITLFFENLYPQINLKSSKNLYFCFPVDDVFYLDEGNPSSLELDYKLNVAFKMHLKNVESEIFLSHKSKEIENLTDINIDEKYYISTDKGVFESHVIGYKLMNTNYYNEFYVVLKPTSNYIYESTQINTKYFICSKNELFNTIINTEVNDSEIKDKAINEIFKYTKLVKEKREFEEGFQLNIYSGSFTKSDVKEYAVSFNITFDFNKYFTMIFILNENCKPIRKTIVINEDNDFGNRLVSVSDINNDGKNELIILNYNDENSKLQLLEFDEDHYVELLNGTVNGV